MGTFKKPAKEAVTFFNRLFHFALSSLMVQYFGCRFSAEVAKKRRAGTQFPKACVGSHYNLKWVNILLPELMATDAL